MSKVTVSRLGSIETYNKEATYLKEIVSAVLIEDPTLYRRGIFVGINGEPVTQDCKLCDNDHIYLGTLVTGAFDQGSIDYWRQS